MEKDDGSYLREGHPEFSRGELLSYSFTRSWEISPGFLTLQLIYLLHQMAKYSVFTLGFLIAGV